MQSRSKQKLNVTRGLEPQRITLWHFFQSWQSTQAQRDGLLFFTIFLHEQHKQYISFPFLQHIDLKTYQQLLARSCWHRWNVAFIHCQSASVRTKTSGGSIASKMVHSKIFINNTHTQNSIISSSDILVDFLGSNYAYEKLRKQTSKA